MWETYRHVSGSYLGRYPEKARVPKIKRPQVHRYRIFSFCCPQIMSEVVSTCLRRLKREDRSPGFLPNPHPLRSSTLNVVLMDPAGGPAGGTLRTVENNMALD